MTLAPLVVLAACGSAAPAAVPQLTTTVSRAAIATAVSGQLGTPQGPAPIVTCPADLPTTVGAAEQCTLAQLTPPAHHPVDVRITAVTGGSVQYATTVEPATTKGFDP